MTSHRRAGPWPFAVLSVACAAISMPCTFTGPAVAISDIAGDLGGGPVALNWVTNAFMLAFGATLMAMGTLADRFGRRRIYLGGLALFIAASALAAISRDILFLNAMRAAQGIGAAAGLSAGGAALAQMFEGPLRLRMFSVIGTSFGVGLAFGPIASGVMIETFGWRAIFVLALSLAGSAFVLGWATLAESRDPQARGLDGWGAASFTAALTALVFAVLRAPERGWSDPSILLLLASSLAAAAAFVAIERRVAQPMLDLSLFRYPRFVAVQLLAAAPAYGFVVLLVLLPVRFIGIEGLDPIAAGRMMLALCAPLLALPLVAGQLTRWISVAAICGAGLLIVAVGLVWLSRAPVGEVEASLGAMVMIGVGIALPWGLMDGLAVSVVPTERAGMATGIFSTTRVAGEGVALAIVGALFSSLLAARLGDGNGSARAAQDLAIGDLAGALDAAPTLERAFLIAQYDDAFGRLCLILAAITAATAIVVFTSLRRGDPGSDDI